MAEITYDEHLTCTNVVVTPASDAEVITLVLGFHPSSMHGWKFKDNDESILVYWQPGLANTVAAVGSDFGGTPAQASYGISTSFALVGPDPLVGDGVSKERLALGAILYGSLVTESVVMYLTLYR
jgi:hypothetical protein